MLLHCHFKHRCRCDLRQLNSISSWQLSGAHCLNYSLLLSLDLFHHLLLGALRTDYVLAVLDEALADHGDLATGAEEALVVPGESLEGHEPGTAKATAT